LSYYMKFFFQKKMKQGKVVFKDKAISVHWWTNKKIFLGKSDTRFVFSTVELLYEIFSAMFKQYPVRQTRHLLVNVNLLSQILLTSKLWNLFKKKS